MSFLKISLFFACALLLCGLSFAVEVQPSAQDWNDLKYQAFRAQDEVKYLLSDIRERRKELNRHTLDVRGVSVPRSYVDPLSNDALLNDLEQQSKKAANDIAVVVDSIKKLKEADRTRQKFLNLRRAAKTVLYQCNMGRRKMYDGDTASREKSQVLELERMLKASKDAPPQIIPAAPLPKGLQLGFADFPRIDGSTTAQPLSTLIACRMLGMGAQWGVRQIRDSRNAEGTLERILTPYCGGKPTPVDQRSYFYGINNDAGLNTAIVHSGTHTAYRNLTLGVSDFIIVARPPSPDELALAKEKGVELELTTIGYDAFIFLLHKDNPVNSLTVKQLQDIYQDNVFSWAEVGGTKANVIAYQRERNSGSQETMESLVMKGKKMAPPERMMIGYGMGGPYNLLDNSPNGIGYTFYYYHTVQSPENPAIYTRMNPEARKPGPGLKICAINGILPTAETIGNKTYPYVTEVYAVVRKSEAKESSALRLRDWLLTEEGQALVEESGYVGLGK